MKSKDLHSSRRFLASVIRKTGSKWERLFETQCKLAGLPESVREFKFHPTRQWRFDFVFWWPENSVKNRGIHDFRLGIAVEIDGGGFVQGRHSRGKGMENDALKICEGIRLGWLVLRFTPDLIESGYGVELVKGLLDAG